MDRPQEGAGARRRRLLRPAVQPADGRTKPPRAVSPSAWILPDPAFADPDGVVGVGADLSAPTLVEAYRNGIFPWPHPGVPLPWFSPDPRAVVDSRTIHVSRSLRRTLRRCGWHTTVDRAFADVLVGCGTDRGEEGTWITPAMRRAYQRLHELGWAHSVEVWDADRLVGGIYGVQAGGVFTGESMFHRETDASKVAMLDLLERFHEAGGRILDVQVTTDHLASMGARDMSRQAFLDLLHEVRDDEVRMLVEDLPVRRLVE